MCLITPFVSRGALPFGSQGTERDGDIKHVVKNIIGGAWEQIPREDISIKSIGEIYLNILVHVRIIWGIGSLAYASAA